MTTVWDWFDEHEAAYEESGDHERLKMARFALKGILRQEANPKAAIEIFKRGREAARRLKEPWWVYHYDILIAEVYKDEIADLPRALRQLIQCVNDGRTPALRANPWRLAAHN